MTPLPRFLAYSLVLLLTLIAACISAQAWMRHQEQQILSAAETELRGRIEAAIQLTGGLEAPWDEQRLAEISSVTDSHLRLTDGPLSHASVTGRDLVIPVGSTLHAIARLPISPSNRILVLYQRILLALGVFAVALATALVIALMFRQYRERDTRSPFLSRQRDLRSLSFLAQESVRQQAELDQERDVRIRAETEARYRLQLLNRALEEKIRIGRDLHDGVIQSLYAAGLTFQSAQSLAASAPDKANEQLDSGLALINTTIRDIRAYIHGLSPASVRQASIEDAVRTIVEELRAGRPVDLELRVDDHVAAQLTDNQLNQTLQIVRESVSNALRHGGAMQLVITLVATTEGIEIAIRDDGRGFDLNEPNQLAGRGLANMRARGKLEGGSLDVQSEIGRGTMVRLVWQIANSI